MYLHKVKLTAYNRKTMKYEKIGNLSYTFSHRLEELDLLDVSKKVSDIVKMNYDLDKNSQDYNDKFKEAFDIEMIALGFSAESSVELRI